VSELFENKTILVTGGSGSIGSEIVRQLLDEKVARVIVYDSNETKDFLLTQHHRDKRLEVILGDVRDLQLLSNVFTKFKIDYIYHAAALKHVVMCERSPIEPVKTNIMGTQNLLDLAIEHGVSKFILISTDKAVYPTNVMGATKFIAERLVLNASNYAKKGQAFSCIRFGNVANSRGSVIPVFIENMISGKTIQVTDRNVTRFTMKIEDAVSLILLASQHMAGGEIFLLKMKAFLLGDLVEAFIKTSQMLNLAKPEIVEIGLRSGEKIHEDLANDLELSNVFELEDMYVIMSLGAKPKQGLKKISLESYCSNSVPKINQDELVQLITECYKSQIFE
jgi:FlaA1/EpsC-like NDP-sugar epimerase